MEDAVDKFCTTSNIQGRRVEMGCMPVLDDGSVVSSDLLHAASDSWWREQLDLLHSLWSVLLMRCSRGVAYCGSCPSPLLYVFSTINKVLQLLTVP